MLQIAEYLPETAPRSRGGRVGSAALRRSYELSQDFAGLEATVNRYDLLLLVKRAGKAAGFTPKLIQLLDYYMAFTREVDWEQGGRAIVYQSLTQTALDLGVSERQVQRLEQGLFELGSITWNDSGNHRRMGQRCPSTGRILWAFGVDLTPLAFLKPDLEAKLAQKQARDRAWTETKRQISWYRRQICAVLFEAEEGAHAGDWLREASTRYQAIALPIRTYMAMETLQGLLAQHKELHAQVLHELKAVTLRSDSRMTGKESSTDDTGVVHYNYTTQESFNELNTGRPPANCFQESVPQPLSDKAPGAKKPQPISSRSPDRTGRDEEVTLSTGLQHITPKQALNAASPRFKSRIPMQPRAMTWADLVEAGYSLISELHVSQKSWGEACGILGREGAAICLLLTDQAVQRETDPVRKPGAYFRAMINRAKTGELHLHSSVFGLLKREEGANAD